MYRDTRTMIRLILAAAGFVVAVSVGVAADGNLKRLSAEFQNNSTVGGSGEIFTTAPAGPGGSGGLVVYSKTLNVRDDVDVLYVTFSAQGDSHQGSALLMNATVNGALVQPLAGQTAGGGGGIHLQTGWYTLSHLPDAGFGTNCNDGGGGSADCHDNAIYFSGCARVAHTDDGDDGDRDDKGRKGEKKDKDKGKDTDVAKIEIKLANLPGGGTNYSFYERATIYIDGQGDRLGQLCKGVGTAPH
jgi:hypothetical protein